MSMDFRTRSADVRREAADILLRFRSTRAARRAGDAATMTETAAVCGPAAPTASPTLPISPDTAELIREARDEARAPASEPEPAPMTEARSPQGDSEAPDPAAPEGHPSHDTVPELPEQHRGKSTSLEADSTAFPPADPPIRAEGALTGAREDQLPSIDEPQPDAGAADLALTPELGSVPSDQAHPAAPHGDDGGDLMGLPGVGAGLVWLLGRCGVHSLRDLAAADAAQLERDLGLVGQLLDLPSWIDLARQTVPTRPTHAPEGDR